MGRRSEEESFYSCGKDCKVVKARPLALLVFIPSVGEVWVPQSQIHPNSEVYDAGEGKEGELVVTEWYAVRMGWR